MAYSVIFTHGSVVEFPTRTVRTLKLDYSVLLWLSNTLTRTQSTMFKKRQPLWLRLLYLWINGVPMLKIHRYAQIELNVDILLKFLTMKIDDDAKSAQVRAANQIRACIYVLDKVYKSPTI